MLSVVLFVFVFAGTVQYSGAVCPDGFQRHQQSCYHFSGERQTWAGASYMCSIIGTHLVEIDSADEDAFITQQIKTKNHNWWIGLTDVSEEGLWVWMASKNKLSGRYTNWAPNEPSTFSSNEPENCGIFYTSGQWNDGVCTNFDYYICEIEDENGEIVG